MNFSYGDREIKEVPKAFADRLTRVGGRNIYGEPMYRVVWGQSRMAWIGPNWEPKYMDHVWHLEKWVPPSFYAPDKETWERLYTHKLDGEWVEMLGPFPYRGDYEEVSSFVPVELSQTYADFLVNVMETSRHFGHEERRSAILKKENKKESDWDAYADDVLQDAFSPFHGAPYVSLSHKGVR